MFTIIGGDGNKYGPVPADQIHRWMAEGRVTVDTQAQRSGEDAWARLGDFAEFSTMRTPPPMVHEVPEPVPTAMGPILKNTYAAAPTAEGEKPLAARSVRLVAKIIDTILDITFMLPGCIMMALKALKDGVGLEDIQNLDITTLQPGFSVMVVGGLIITVIQMWMLTRNGQTIGKRVMGIRVVRTSDESNPGFVRSVLMRTFIPALVGSLPYVGILFSITNICFIFREDRRCLHDLVADTKVVEA